MPKNHRLALFKYPGGKSKRTELFHRYLAPDLEKAESFHEVFVGAGPILLYVASAYPNLALHANDLDDTVAAFWSVVSDPDPTDFEEMCSKFDIVPSLDIFYKERETAYDDDRPRAKKAFHCVFFHKTTFSGMYGASPIGGKEQKSKWKVGCHYTPSKFVPKIREARKRLVGRLTVTSIPAEDYLRQMEHAGAVVYADPPYYVAGKSLYPVFMEEAQHQDLAKALEATSCPWVLSYDDHPKIRELYSWADIREEPFRYSSASFRKEGTWTEKVELVVLPHYCEKETPMSLPSDGVHATANTTGTTVAAPVPPGPRPPAPPAPPAKKRGRKPALPMLEQIRVDLRKLITEKNEAQAKVDSLTEKIVALRNQYKTSREDIEREEMELGLCDRT